jgi:(hydroxyamino)benzene mutase
LTDVDHQLALAGIILFLLGLLNGFIIPLGRSPRLGLSAHLTAVQSGTFLIAMAVLWPHIGLPSGARDIVASGLWISLYMLWLSLCLAGLLGAGRGLPIAGGGIETTPLRQMLVSTLLGIGVVGSTIATAFIALFIIF